MSRWIIIVWIGLGGLAGGFLSCQAGVTAASSFARATRSFQSVTVPAQLQTPAERAEWLALHYWDQFDFTDTTDIRSTLFFEQALSDYLYILQQASPVRQAEGLKALLWKAETGYQPNGTNASPQPSLQKAFLNRLDELLEAYLAFSYSPMQDNEMYIAVLEYITQSDSWSEEEKIRPSILLELCLKNRKGTPATDFDYVVADGTKSHLYALSSPYVILFFYDPECTHCRQEIEQMQHSKALNKALEKHQLQLLTIYPYADTTAWRTTLANLPTAWINSYNPESTILSDELYELKITPALYLLDSQKKVLVREGSLSEIEQALIPANEQ